MKDKIQFLSRRGRFKSLMSELEELGIQCNVISNNYDEKYSAIPNIGSIRSISSRAKADVFVTSNPYYGLIGASLAKKMGNIKYSVFRPVGDYWTENNYRYGKFNYRIRCFLKMLENSLALRDVDFTLAVSDWLRKKADSKGLKRVYTLYNGVDCIRFRPRENDERYSTQILCVMSFNIYQKIANLYNFLTEYKNSKLPYHITFLGNGLYLNSLKKHVILLGLDKQVTFKGWVNNIEDYYSNCDIIIHPSSLDAFPTTLLEAGASAKPVVATKVGGIPEIILDGKTGFLTNDVNHFLFYIKKLMEDIKLKRKIGMEARQRIIDNFTWKNAAMNFCDILKSENVIE